MKNNRSGLVASALFAATSATIFALSTWLGGCSMSRLPVCQTNEDCETTDATTGPKLGICYNLRCVECRYDSDCKDGNICNSISECKSLGGVGDQGTGSSASSTSTGGETKSE